MGSLIENPVCMRLLKITEEEEFPREICHWLFFPAVERLDFYYCWRVGGGVVRSCPDTRDNDPNFFQVPFPILTNLEWSPFYTTLEEGLFLRLGLPFTGILICHENGAIPAKILYKPD